MISLIIGLILVGVLLWVIETSGAIPFAFLPRVIHRVLSLTDQASPFSFLQPAQDEISFNKGMSSGAMGPMGVIVGQVAGRQLGEMFSPRDGHEMLGIDATSILAPMVEFQSLRDRAHE